MTWISDGSPQLHINENCVFCTGSVATHCNTLWQDDLNASNNTNEAYWSIKLMRLERGGASVGLCNKEKFQRGNKIQCLSYNGNLTCRSVLLVGEFGPRLQSGDVVGILACVEGSRLRVYIYINEVCLGLACDIPADSLQRASPVVRFSDVGSALCSRHYHTPTVRSRQVPELTGLEGHWSLDVIEDASGQAVDLDKYDVHPTLHYTQRPEMLKVEYIGVLKFLNSYRFRVCPLNGDRLECLGGPRAMIRGSKDLMELEGGFMELVTHPLRVEIRPYQLFLENDQFRTRWRRVNLTPTPYVGNPFL